MPIARFCWTSASISTSSIPSNPCSGLTDKEKGQILSINQTNDPARKYKEVWLGLGGVQSAVYATETSVEEYLTYTTEETEKLEVTHMTEKLGGNMEQAIRGAGK